MMHFMKLNPHPFSQIKNGSKDIEVRLYDQKRQMIKPGDGITFTNIVTNEEIVTECVAMHRGKSFYELFCMINDNERMGFDKKLSHREAALFMREYYPGEKEKHYGVVGIEIALCNK